MSVLFFLCNFAKKLWSINVKDILHEKILLLLSVIASFYCNNEEFYNGKENVSENLPEENFNVTRSDIEKVVADYFYSTHTSAKESGF